MLHACVCVVGRRRIPFRNIPEWNFAAFAARADRPDCRNRKRRNEPARSRRSDRRRLASLLARLHVRSIDPSCISERRPTANVNYRALFLFIHARWLQIYRLSVIKNVFFARLCLLKGPKRDLKFKKEKKGKIFREQRKGGEKDEERERKRCKGRK